MGSIIKRKVLEGVYWIEVPDADLRVICGCPADTIKHLSLKGLLPLVRENGIEYESGPNAILLSDDLIQNGQLSNVSEFIAYHMFYTQGTIIPTHPNSKKPKPLMIGKKDQVDAQMEYITRGNYGLTKVDEFLACGESKAFAKENIAMKRRFALDRFAHTRELIQGIYLDRKRVELRGGVTLRRLKRNVFVFSYGDKRVQVDLNLRQYRHYLPSFKLPTRSIPNHYFSVVHTGEGDGWNPDKPSLSSVIQFDGQFFLVDAGPHIVRILRAVGLKAKQLSGIFITHVHDDHVAGLFSLANSRDPLTIFATPVIRQTIITKLAALLSVSDKTIMTYFRFQELKRNVWNMREGIEIMPIPTAHPVDTTILVIRARGRNRYYSYGHFSDIAALKWLKQMIFKKNEKSGISKRYFEDIKSDYAMPLDLKKIDVGGPPIHGDAADFAADKSKKIVLGHSHTQFTKEQLAIGKEVRFGHVDVLIKKSP